MAKHLLFIIIICTVSIGFGQTTYLTNWVDHYTSGSYMDSCAKDSNACYYIELERELGEDTVWICFPSGGTASDVYLYADSTYNKYKDIPYELYGQHYILHDATIWGGHPCLNMSRLPDGDYVAALYGCSWYGKARIRLKSKK